MMYLHILTSMKLQEFAIKRSLNSLFAGIIEEILQDCLGSERASREFRAKFPDDVLQETLGGQLWFGAEVRMPSS